MFLISRFELEDSQYVNHHEVMQLKGSRTSKQLADLQEKCNALFCLIQNWHEVQLIYTPHVASPLLHMQVPQENGVSAALSPPETLAENIPLYLLSSLPPHICTLPELKEICQLE